MIAAVAPLWEELIVPGIGSRIATYRRRRGLSQAVLAGLVGRSESWLSQVERGLRPVENLPVIRDLATHLRISIDTLVGGDLGEGDETPDDLRTAAVVAALVDHFTTHPALHTQLSAPPGHDLDSLLEQANRAYQGANYAEAVQVLTESLPLIDASQDDDLYIGYYVLTSKVLLKTGDHSTAMLAADRAAQRAIRGGPVRRAFAGRQIVEGLLRSGRGRVAENLASDLAAAVTGDDPESLSIAGSLQLMAAVSAARRTERFEALTHLEQADQFARRLGYDGNHLWTAFGLTNVAIHTVSIAAELGDAAEAARIAAQIDTSALPAGLAGRRAQIHIDLAWAYCTQRRDAEATLQLLEAERISSDVLRHHHRAHRVLQDLLNRRKTSAATGMISDLAARVGTLA